MGERQPKRMTPDEFFEWQARQDKNYELVDGVPVLPIKAMTGATRRHDRVTVNAIISLGNKLRGGPCLPSTDDIAIRIPNGRVRRPDIFIECGSPAENSTEADDPRVVLEILSPSTMRYDRFQKLEEYKTHPAIRVILLVDTEAPQITVWRRHGDEWGRTEAKGLDTVIELSEIGVSLELRELYAGAKFDE